MTGKATLDDSAFPWFLVHPEARRELGTFWLEICRHAVRLLDLDDCSLAVIDQQAEQMIRLAVAGKSEAEDSLETVILPLDRGGLSRALTLQRPVLLVNACSNALLQPTEERRTVAYVPLLEQEMPVGILVASRARSTHFEPQDMVLLSLLVRQAGLALTNIRQIELTRDAERMKSHFLSLLTHALRAPLNSINGYLDLALSGMGGDLSEEHQEFIQRARAGSEQLYALIEDLLLVARADADQLRLRSERLDLSALVQEVFEELALTAAERQVHLQDLLPSDLPDLSGDRIRLLQVLRNLLLNALQASPSGSQITVRARVLDEQAAPGLQKVEIAIHDMGPGIAPMYHQKIFERFFQIIPPGGNRPAGQGLGLTIARLLVEAHNGSIRVESTPGEGSTFFIVLFSALKRVEQA